MAFTMASVGADSKSIHERRRPAENAVRPLMIGEETISIVGSPTKQEMLRDIWLGLSINWE